MGDCGLRLQVKPLKGDQDEDDQLTKNEDLNALREGNALYETQRKRVALMKLKKWKDVPTEIEKITNSELNYDEQLCAMDAMNNFKIWALYD